MVRKTRGSLKKKVIFITWLHFENKVLQVNLTWFIEVPIKNQEWMLTERWLKNKEKEQNTFTFKITEKDSLCYHYFRSLNLSQYCLHSTLLRKTAFKNSIYGFSYETPTSPKRYFPFTVIYANKCFTLCFYYVWCDIKFPPGKITLIAFLSINIMLT